MTAPLEHSHEALRFADLVVEVGSNVQPGQDVELIADIGTEEAVRAVAAAAYRRGARFVDVLWFDVLVKRERLLHAALDTLDYVPPEFASRMRRLGDERGARIWIQGNPHPRALADIDPARTALDELPRVKERIPVTMARTTNWTLAPWPTPGWAADLFPSLQPDEAYERLREELAYVCRLDREQPGEAWQERLGELVGAAARLTDARLDALRFRGPGTDLTVGLFASSGWETAWFERVDGLRHLANIPTEEVLAAPDPARVDGVVRATRPLELSGQLIEGIEMRFERGRAVQIDASQNVELLRGVAARDDGASRVGEVALVDRSSRVGHLGTVFGNTLLDENAASHIALGNAYTFSVRDPAERARANESVIHVDFMIGSDEVDVDGILGDGRVIPLLRRGSWQL